jgi:uncharacterized surface protein with fasciclin (FAS1) repeats
MKKNFTVTLKSLLALSIVAILGVGCQKEIAQPEEGFRNATVSELEAKAAPAKGTQTIVELALGNPNFSELVEALQYVDAAPLSAGLIPALNGTDQYTVFAPTNQAFEDLYKFLGISNITDLPQGLVAAVLQYHVTKGRRAANSVVPPVGERRIQTLLTGANFTVDRNKVITATGSTNNIGKNNATITTANLSASNGIIHVINQVIIP